MLLAADCSQLEKLYGSRETPTVFFNLEELHTELLPSSFDVDVSIKPKSSVAGAELAYGGMISVFDNPLKEMCANCQNNIGKTMRGRVEISAALKKAGWNVQDFVDDVRTAADPTDPRLQLSDVIEFKLAGPGAAAMRAVEGAGPAAGADALAAEAPTFSLGPWSVSRPRFDEPAAFQMDDVRGDNAVAVLG